MRILLKSVLCVVAVCCVIGCRSASSPSNDLPNYDRLSLLRKGMDSSAIVYELARDMENGTDTIAQTNYRVKTVRFALMRDDSVVGSITETRHNSNSYFQQAVVRKVNRCNNLRLVFDKGKLLYWGFDYELHLLDVPEIRDHTFRSYSEYGLFQPFGVTK